jgi:hypothetical protein
MWQTITSSLSIIAGIACFVFTWRVYHHFWSLAEAVHESNFSYFVKRFAISCAFGFGGLVLVASYFEPNVTKNDNPNSIPPISEVQSTLNSSSNKNTSSQNQNSTDSAPTIDLTKSLKENFSPSFDCSKTNLEADIAVCNNYYLSTIDVKNAELYKFAYAKNPQIAQSIRSASYRQKIECGSDIKCIGEIYALSLGRYSEIIGN